MRRANMLNVLVLYDSRWVSIATVREHLQAFARHSRHHICYLPATVSAPWANWRRQPAWNLSPFDAVVVHYSARLTVEGFLPPSLVQAIAAFSGLKMAFLQDEYEATETTRRALDRMQFDTVYTCVPPEGIEHIYPRARYPHTRFIRTLTGYVPEDAGIERFARPLAERDIHIGYRGRRMPHHYGALGFEKYQIGLEVRRLAEARGAPVDIEVDDSRRIYGEDWYRFLGSCRATLGTESGANIFDCDGSLAALGRRLASQPFEAVYARHFAAHDGKVRMNQVSPKIFEAIRLRTALVLFEGEYSGVVQPDVHYIALKKDFSNIDEVLAKVADARYLEAMTARAYSDVIGSGAYSYAGFARGVDRDIETGVGQRAARAPAGVALAAIRPYGGFGRENLQQLSAPSGPSTTVAAVARVLAGAARSAAVARVLRPLWHLLPEPARLRIAARLLL